MYDHRVVVRWVVFVFYIYVKLLVMKGHCVESLAEWVALVAFKGSIHLFVSWELMSGIKWDHNKRNILFD